LSAIFGMILYTFNYKFMTN